MGQVVTVIGASGSTIAVTLDGARAVELAAKFTADLMRNDANKQLNVFNVDTNGFTNDGKVQEGVNTEGGNFTVSGAYNYIITGGFNQPWDAESPIFLDKPVSIESQMKFGQMVNVLAGGNKGVSYKAGEEGGNFIAGNIGSNVVFEGNSVSGGNWTIDTGKGNDTIFTGSGNNIVNSDDGDDSITTGTGENMITLGVGSNVVNSYGNDTIDGPNIGGFNTINLHGASTQDSYTTVHIGKGSLVNDFVSYNVITVGGGSTVAGGTSSTVMFDGSYDSNMNWLQGVRNSTISSDQGNLSVDQGNDNTLNIDGDLSFFNGGGVANASVSGLFAGFGVQGLNFTLTGNGDRSGLFVGSLGNETLDASNLQAGLQVYSNTVVGGFSTLDVKGSSANDLFAAGTGDSTFTGGGGSNVFFFAKGSDDGGKTVITDFSKASGDNISLFNYGLDANSLQELLNNSKDEDSSAVLNLDGHKITLQGVSVSDLTVNQFTVYNTPTKTS